MFENAEPGHEVDKVTYEREAPLVRASLMEPQRELASADEGSVLVMKEASS